MDKFTPEKRSQIMSKIGGKNTKPELLMRKALHSMGLRYRLHDKRLPGKPDLVFRSQKVVVFVDGDWWHGRNFAKESQKYPPFWQIKIKTNMARDKRVNKELRKMGWKVFRVWQKDLEKEPLKHAGIIYDYLKGGKV
jgi:DNA mismatch endonuclease (patch repair protein)